MSGPRPFDCFGPGRGMIGIAEDETGRTIGRVYRHHSGGWFWAFQAHGPDIDWPDGSTSHVADTKQEAADKVREMFERCRKQA